MQTAYVIELEDSSVLPSMTETSAMIVSSSKPDTDPGSTDPVAELPLDETPVHKEETPVVEMTRAPDSAPDTVMSDAVVSTTRPNTRPDSISLSNGELANPEDGGGRCRNNKKLDAMYRHLPPWLLPGYGSDGPHWPAGTPPDTQQRVHNWKNKYENVGSGERGTPQHQVELQPAPCLEILDQHHDCIKAGCQRVIINVSGQRYETQLRTLNRFPETLLGDPMKRKQFWDARRNEFFIDRHRPSFQAILYYYQSGGRLRRPIEVPEDIFLEELEFYQLGEDTIRDYKDKEGFLMEEVTILPKQDWQRKLFLFCEEPDSSRAARVFAIISVTCILISIVNFCLETLPSFERSHCVNVTGDDGVIHLEPNYSDVFFMIESICVTWFTIEFILRVIASPSKFTFCKSIMNIFDVLAILPYFIILITVSTAGNCENAKKSGSFIFIRVLRVFRIFKLSKHSQGLRILGMTIKTSLRELGMFFFFLIVAMVIFSSAAYYAEAGEKDSQLKSIPGAFWWAIVTMTTVGYGDVTPVGVWGKLVGALCVIAGVLTIALPVPVVVANFNNFYRHESGRGYISA